MNPRLMRLAAEMLEEYASKLGRNMCNDWDPPKYLKAEDLTELAALRWRSNGSPADESPTDEVRSDFMVAYALAQLFQEELQREEPRSSNA